MNNEIKEILDKLNNHIDHIQFANLTNYEIRALLDYITNLQEELEEEKRIEQESLKTIQDLQEEIQKRDAYIKYLEERTTIQGKVFYGDAREELQEKINKANEILEQILVVSDWEHKGRYRPVKNTTSQDVYKTIVMLNELLETPHRTNYKLLQGEDKDE